MDVTKFLLSSLLHAWIVVNSLSLSLSLPPRFSPVCVCAGLHIQRRHPSCRHAVSREKSKGIIVLEEEEEDPAEQNLLQKLRPNALLSVTGKEEEEAEETQQPRKRRGNVKSPFLFLLRDTHH